jgi:hypothetical protein
VIGGIGRDRRLCMDTVHRGDSDATIHGMAWGGTLAVALAVGIVAATAGERGPWDDWVAARELHRPTYAERIHPEQFLRTRANTWSNLAYCLVGFYACGLSVRDWRRAAAPAGTLVSTPGLGMVFGVACVWLGLSSGLFHASLTRLGQQFDVAAMYGPLMALLAIVAARALPKRVSLPGGQLVPIWPFLAGIVVAAEVLLMYFKWSMSSRAVLWSLIGCVTATSLAELALRPRRFRSGLLAWAGVFLAAAVACRQLDVVGRFSSPDAWFQGHAAWHVLTAASLGAMVLYERSERPA